MKIKYSFVILLFLTIGSSAFAQSQTNDDLEKIARKDARNFKLSKTDLKLYRKSKSGRTSDYFKPTASKVTELNLLKDSTYVTMYRNLAYSKTSRRKGAVEYVIIAGAIVVLAGISALVTL